MSFPNKAIRGGFLRMRKTMIIILLNIFKILIKKINLNFFSALITRTKTTLSIGKYLTNPNKNG